MLMNYSYLADYNVMHIQLMTEYLLHKVLCHQYNSVLLFINFTLNTSGMFWYVTECFV